MSGHLQPIKLDSYKPLRELVCENIRQAIIVHLQPRRTPHGNPTG